MSGLTFRLAKAIFTLFFFIFVLLNRSLFQILKVLVLISTMFLRSSVTFKFSIINRVTQLVFLKFISDLKGVLSQYWLLIALSNRRGYEVRGFFNTHILHFWSEYSLWTLRLLVRSLRVGLQVFLVHCWFLVILI